MPNTKAFAAFEVADHIWVEELASDYPVIHLSNDQGTASVALHGAHLISYIPNRQEPVIFTSQEAIYKEGTAIRGGIPICWPWFNTHPSDPSKPSHGVARTQFWEIKNSDHSTELTSITLELTHEKIKATVTISLGKSLEISLTSTNLSDTTKTIGGALHSYFNVSNIDKASISGLDNNHYIDTLTETEEIQDGDIFITEETDRIYLNTDETISIYDAGWNRSIFIDKTGSQSTVVWNPWITKSKAISDLNDQEYMNFVCVETANARSDIYHLAPSESHTLSTRITVV